MLMPRQRTFGFDELRSFIAGQLRPIFQSAIERETDNDLYAFVLRTDDDGTIITAACNSEANLQEIDCTRLFLHNRRTKSESSPMWPPLDSVH
jgi:hypothetical protein